MLPDHDRTSRFRSPFARAALGLALSASLLVSAGPSFAQSDEDKAAARALATQGSDALKANKYAEALDLVTRAEALVHAPTHLLMIARAQAGLGKYVAAKETYLKLMREELKDNAPAAFKNAQASAKEEVAAIEPKIASLKIILDGPGAKKDAKVTVKMDDVQVPPALVGVYRPVDPGAHVIAAFPVGQSPVKGNVELKDGEKKDFKLTIPDGPPPPGVPLNPADNPDAAKTPDNGAQQQPAKDTASPGFFTPLRGAGFGAAGVGVAGVVVGAIFMAKGASTQSQANQKAVMLGCTNDGANCPKSAQVAVEKEVTPLDKDAASQKTIGVIGLGVGVAALGAGVALIIVGKPKPAAAASAGPAKASIAPWFTGTMGGLRGEF